MIHKLIVVSALAAALGSGVRAQEFVPRELLGEAAAASPEVAQARAALEAERARVSQVGALPDPTLSLGIQNDGFARLNIGTAETSFLSIGLTQPLPWPGKRSLREQLATLEARRSQARLERALLELDGRVRRASLALLLAQGERELLAEQEQLWAQAEQVARSRYETGQVPQSELLRAQLVQARLPQRRWALEAQVATQLAGLNRLRGRAPDAPLELPVRLVDLRDPPLLAEADAQRDAEERSPELLLASLGVEEAGRRVELARRERLPDFAVSAAVMPRGGLEPMWLLGLSVGLPLFKAQKQERAVDESVQRSIGESAGAQALRQLLRLRAHERLLALAALNQTNQQYRSQILVLSAAGAKSALSDYAVGRAPFAAALEALAGYAGDRTAYLGSIAAAQLVAIAQREVSLEAAPSIDSGAALGVAARGTTGM